MKLQIEDITNKPYSMIEPKDIYESLWRCRDFELSHLWQRSVFLTAFILMVYTGYGAVMLNVLNNDSLSSDRSKILLFVGLVILLLGILLSQLWILMAKGSKAWYEMYEQAIYKIEHSEKYASKVVVNDMSSDAVVHGDIENPKEINNCLSSTKAGAYSPSKINVMIGQLSFGVLLIAYLAQTVFMACVVEYNIINSLSTVLIVIIPLLVVLCFSCSFVKARVKSSYMSYK